MTFLMRTSSNGNIFRVTGPLWGEFTGHRWIPRKGQWCGALMFSLICAWINGWVNNREDGDLRRHHGHYDVNRTGQELCYLRTELAQWGRDKMAAISQTTLSNAFSCMQVLEFRLKFHWSFFLRVKSTILQHWFRYWLGADKATSHYLNQWWVYYRRIYVSVSLNELIPSTWRVGTQNVGGGEK